MDAGNAIFSPTNADFEALPPTVKRKYFSTLERLRYAQGQAPEPAMNQARPKTSSGSKYSFGKSGRFHRPTARQTKDKDIASDLPLRQVTEAESTWYQNLPEKIKRNHFTFEERHLYAGREDSPHVLDATEELFYRLGGGRQGNRSLPSLSSNSDCEGDDSTFDEVIDTPLDSHDAAFDEFRELDLASPVDLAHDDYHTHVADTANVVRRPSTSDDGPGHRKRAVTNFSSPRPHISLDRGRSCGDLKTSRDQTSTSQQPHPPRSSSIAAISTVSTAASSRPSIFERRASRRHVDTEEEVPPVPMIDPEAAHFSDPATRLKLKLYLGSAAKFDEALEFGFPATAIDTPPASARSIKRSGSMSFQSRRRSRSLSTMMTNKRESTTIGTTFFMDNDEDESFIIDPLSTPIRIPEELSPVVDEDDIHTFYAELPADNQPSFDSNTDITTPHTAPANVQHSSTLPAHIHSKPHLRSQSISLRPRQHLALDIAVAQQNTMRPLMSAREKPLKPWIEPTDSIGEREMTLRMTLTRKDLRADDSLIYPDNGAGSWDAAEQDSAARNGDNKWRFWQRRR